METTSGPEPVLSDLIGGAQARFEALDNYAVTLRSAPAQGEPVEVRYQYRKPGLIRMDFVHPHAGATLVFNPETGKVLLWPFGFHTFPKLTLNPDSPMIQGPSGHRVDRSDLGGLLANVRQLQQAGQVDAGGDTADDADAAHLVVTGASGHAVEGVHRYRLWFDAATGLPVKVISEDANDAPIETVWLDELCVDCAEIGPFL
jgi:hypothetical protein